MSAFDARSASPATGEGATNGHTAPPPGPFTPPPGPFTPPAGKRPWYRRWSIVVVTVVVVVIAASVITDLPQHTTRAQQITAADTVIKSVDTGIHPCTYAISQTFSLYQSDSSGALSASERAQIPGLVSQDVQGCSFANQSVVDISTITIPNTPAGRDLGSVIRSVYEWMTSDAVAAMNDMQILIANPRDASARADLAKQERLLASDRTAADRALQAANRALGGAHVPNPALPALPGPSSAT